MTNAYYPQVRVVPSGYGKVKAKCEFLDFRGYPVIRTGLLSDCSPFDDLTTAKRHVAHYVEKLLAIGNSEDGLGFAARKLIGDNTEDFSIHIVIDIIQITGTSLLDCTVKSAETVTIEVDYSEGGKETSIGVISLMDHSAGIHVDADKYSQRVVRCMEQVKS